MKKIIILILTIIGAGSFSCSEDFLETLPPGVANEQIMATPNGVESLLIGSYHLLYGEYSSGPVMWNLGSLPSDDMHKGEVKGHPVYYIQMETWEVTTDNRCAWETWTPRYDGISRTNDVLKILRITQSSENTIPDERAAEIEAEAKFLRAYYHFDLTKVFEKIPYIKTEEEMGGKKPEEIPNDTEGWEGIESDLQFAIDNLPLTPPKGEVGRPDKYSAMAVKAKAHMFQQEFDQAKTLLDAIINSGEFELVDHYYDNYKATTENNKESLFEIQCTVGYGRGIFALRLQGCTFHQKGPAAFGWGYGNPTQNLFEAFQVTQDGLPILDAKDRGHLNSDYGVESSEEFFPTDSLLDPRLDWTIARRGIPFLDWGVHEGKSWIREQIGQGAYMMKKWMHYEADAATLAIPSGSKNARNFRAVRYAHILLWRAEIAVEDGELDYARRLVNFVRERAQGDYSMGRCTQYQFDGSGGYDVNWDEPAANYKIEPYPPTAEAFSSQEMARKAVRLEHRLEFATEGQRFFQLRRWGIAEEILNYFVIDAWIEHATMKGRHYDSYLDDYLPIPQEQIDIQKGVLTQDPAYE